MVGVGDKSIGTHDGLVGICEQTIGFASQCRQLLVDCCKKLVELLCGCRQVARDTVDIVKAARTAGQPVVC